MVKDGLWQMVEGLPRPDSGMILKDWMAGKECMGAKSLNVSRESVKSKEGEVPASGVKDSEEDEKKKGKRSLCRFRCGVREESRGPIHDFRFQISGWEKKEGKEGVRSLQVPAAGLSLSPNHISH